MLAALVDKIQTELIWKTPERALWFYEQVNPAWFDGYRRINFRNTVRHVAEHSIFYRNLFAKHGINPLNITSPEQFGSLYTTPADLQCTPSPHFLCATPQTAFETTGTLSKNPKRVFYSYKEIEAIGRVGAVGLWRLGVRREDRVASSFDYSFWVSGPTLKASLNFLGAFHVEAGRIEPEEFYDRIKPYGCNIIVADPGWMVRLSEIAAKRGPWLTKLIMIGGENLNEASRKIIEDVWQCPVILTYGQTEAFGMIGAECAQKCGYHINDADLWVEIANPDTDGYGELVYTTVRRNVMPLIRYRSGDVTKLITGTCACGSSSPRLAKLRGRLDDMVVTGVGNIASWMVESAIETLEPPVAEWQLQVDFDGIKDKLLLKMELTNISETQLKESTLNALRLKMPTAYQGIQNGMASFDVKIYPTGDLKGTARKLKRISDLRKY